MVEQPNLGSFGGNVVGGEQQAVQAAIAAREGQGAPVPQLNQKLQGSPIASTPEQGEPLSPEGGVASEKPVVQNAEVEIILKALTQRLNMISKLEAPPTPAGGGGTYGKR
ncbi:MAG TPA: hypothetical protein ENI23_16485 [bacterium]|nr:hypothetical protein [bacterium]